MEPLEGFGRLEKVERRFLIMLSFDWSQFEDGEWHRLRPSRDLCMPARHFRKLLRKEAWRRGLRAEIRMEDHYDVVVRWLPR